MDYQQNAGKIALLKLFLSWMLVLFCVSMNAQNSIRDSSINLSTIAVNYSYHIPSNDLADRFLNSSSLGISFLRSTSKNWLFGFETNFIFRDTVKQNDILRSIETQHGFIIDQNGDPANILLSERGFNAFVKFGKLIPMKKVNLKSGFFGWAGIGLLQHKIRIDDQNNNSPQLKEDYKKGYDYLSNGIAFQQFVGYQYLSNKRLLNFYLGFEVIQAFTKNRRSYNFDLMRKDDEKRTDILTGFKCGWIVPLYKKLPKEFYYY